MIQTLFPYYFVIIILFVILLLSVYWLKIENKWLQIIILIEFALVLWYTPYLMSGFSRLPDSLWHTGISTQIPEVIQGNLVQFSSPYPSHYVGSYIFNYQILTSSGMDSFSYSLFVFPLISIILIVLMWYIIVKKLFNEKVAYVSTIVGIPLLHYIELHPSPHTVGVILLMLGIFILVKVLNEKINYKIMAILIFLFIVVLITHPISSILFLFFFISVLGCRLGSKVLYRKKGVSIFKSISTSVWLALIILLIFFVAILLWIPDIREIFYFGNTEIFGNAGGQSINFLNPFSIRKFIFPEITLLSLLIYASLALFALITLISIFLQVKSLNKKHKTKRFLEGLSRSGIAIICFAILSLALAVMVVLLGHPTTLIERGLMFFLLSISAFIISAWVVKKSRKSLKRILITTGCVFVVMSYPIVGYSMESYINYPPSDDSGLYFLANRIDLNGKDVEMGFVTQLASYIPSDIRFTVEGSMDIVVFRKADYFQTAISKDLSFENNSYLQLYKEIDSSSNYSKVYTNPSFEIYVRGEK